LQRFAVALAHFEIDYFFGVPPQRIHHPVQPLLVADIRPHFVHFIFFALQNGERPCYLFCDGFDFADDG
jgi:hypothetical protein